MMHSLMLNSLESRFDVLDIGFRVGRKFACIRYTNGRILRKGTVISYSEKFHSYLLEYAEGTWIKNIWVNASMVGLVEVVWR